MSRPRERWRSSEGVRARPISPAFPVAGMTKAPSSSPAAPHLGSLPALRQPSSFTQLPFIIQFTHPAKLILATRQTSYTSYCRAIHAPLHHQSRAKTSIRSQQWLIPKSKRATRVSVSVDFSDPYHFVLLLRSSKELRRNWRAYMAYMHTRRKPRSARSMRYAALSSEDSKMIHRIDIFANALLRSDGNYRVTFVMETIDGLCFVNGSAHRHNCTLSHVSRVNHFIH